MSPDTLIQKIKTWDDFKKALAPLGTKAKGDAFERLVQIYLQIDPRHKTKLKRVWLLKELPTHLKNYLKLRSQDQGIDLVAETKSGEYWAIQCKYREDDKISLSLREIATFLSTSFTVCRHISYGLVCTTAGRLTHKVAGAERIGICASDEWLSLSEEFFDEARLFLKKRPIRIKVKSPRPHQRRAIQNAVDHFIKKKNTRGKLIMACGTGKSLAGYWIAEALKAKTILVVVPSLALIKQTLDSWLREVIAKNKDVEWICVCSDETVGKFDSDSAIFSTSELGIPCHTNPKEIAHWLQKTNGQKRVIFTTYQSGKPLSQAVRKEKTVFDLGIMDEAHKTVGAKDKDFARLLFDKNVRIKKRIFMTATERRYKGDSDQIISMDDEAIYGETFELLSFKKALESKPPILSDYRIITVDVTRSEVERLIKNRAFVRPDKGNWDSALTAQDFASLVALRKAVKKYGIKHTISFHGSIERAKTFKDHEDSLTKIIPSFGKLDTFHVSGKLPTSERKNIIQEFCKSKRSLVTNARCLTEGVDIPEVDGVLFADPKQSTIDIVQASGRAMRRAKGKKLGYIIIPLLTKDNATIEEVAESGEFKAVLAILRALAANDDRIIEFFRSISQKRKSKSGKLTDLVEIITSRLNTKQFVQSLEIKCWNRLAKLSWRPFEEAREFVHKLKLNNGKEWIKYCQGKLQGKRKPDDIPAKPSRTYRDHGWKSWGDWLGTGSVATYLRKYRLFLKARAFARELGLKNEYTWRKYCAGQLKGLRKPDDIPQDPRNVYGENNWNGFGDWLGTNRVANRFRKYKSFKKARAFVRKLKLKSQKEWQKYCRGSLNKKRKPHNFPSDPAHVYAEKGWKSWGDWLGTGNVHTKNFLPFKKARAFARNLKLDSVSHWTQYCKGLIEGKKKPEKIPPYPNQAYKNKGWKSWGDWLGTGRIADQLKVPMPFINAKNYV